MPIPITLRPETEKELRKRAAESGLSLNQYLEQLIEGVLSGANGSQAPAPPPAKLPSDEALAPFRREVAESGMSDDELRAFFEELREEVYREKHGRPSKTS